MIVSNRKNITVVHGPCLVLQLFHIQVNGTELIQLITKHNLQANKIDNITSCSCVTTHDTVRSVFSGMLYKNMRNGNTQLSHYF